LSLLRHDERGYSLIEMLTVMTIMSVVMSGLTHIFVTASHADIDMQNRFAAQQNSRLALNKLRRDVHCAYDVSPNTPNPWTSSQSSVTLKITACSSGDVTWCTAQTTGSTTRWSLYRQTGSTCGSASPAIRVAQYLTSSTPFTAFSHVSGCGCLAYLSVDLTVGANRNTATGLYRLQDTLYLRNSTRI
jgi:prepilin-type N-terminal cleavage/methylation domain-containing protein